MDVAAALTVAVGAWLVIFGVVAIAVLRSRMGQEDLARTGDPRRANRTVKVSIAAGAALIVVGIVLFVLA